MEFQEPKRAVSGRSVPGEKQRNKLGFILNFEENETNHDDLHPQIRRNSDNVLPKTKGGLYQKKQAEKYCYKNEELVKYMSNLPCYLERGGEKSQEKAFNIGVLDWRLLEKWEHKNHIDIPPINIETYGVTSRVHLGEPLEAREEIQVHSYADSLLDQSCHTEITSIDSTSEINQMMSYPTSFPISPSILQKLPEDEFYQSKMDSTKVRNSSPNRRFSFGLGKNSNSTVNLNPEKSKLTSNSGDLTCDKSNAANGKSRTSPLRRLLNPLFKPLEKNPSPRDKTLKSSRESAPSQPMKVKLDLKAPQKHEKNGSSTMQALLQVAVKNGLPVFTFTVDNCRNILVGTAKARKRSVNTWVYTIFSFCEMKKKNVHWINQGCKEASHGYASNIVAQLKVSDLPSTESKFVSVSEFVLSSMSTSDELAAIVVRIPEKVSEKEKTNGSGSDESFNVAVILPGGDHGAPRKGDPSPLIERWKSGGLCDCGGWDLGCRIRVLANGNHSSQKFSTAKTQSTTFKLFPQEEVEETKPILIVSPFEEGIFSVEFTSSLEVIQAFSIGIAILSSGMMSVSSTDMFGGEILEGITLCTTKTNKTSSQGTVSAPGEYVSYPPHSPFGRV